MFPRNYTSCGQFYRGRNFLCGFLSDSGGSDFTLENLERHASGRITAAIFAVCTLIYAARSMAIVMAIATAVTFLSRPMRDIRRPFVHTCVCARVCICLSPTILICSLRSSCSTMFSILRSLQQNRPVFFFSFFDTI